MEGFRYEDIFYVDIFASKGTEYLLVIGYLVLLVVFWKIINKAGTGIPGDQVDKKANDSNK